MAKGTSQDKPEVLSKSRAEIPELVLADAIKERLDATDVRARTCKQARLGHDVEYKSPVDVMTIAEFTDTIEADALLAIIRDHVNIMLRRRIPKTANEADVMEALSNPVTVLTTLQEYRYNARSGEVSQATKDKRLGEATRKLMTQFGVDSEDELVEILKTRMSDSNA